MTQGDVNKNAVPGDQIDEFNGPLPEFRTTYFSNDPRFAPARQGWFIASYNSSRNSVSIGDQWRVTRYLTFTPGVAFTTAQASNASSSEKVLDASAITPSVSMAWDATRDGRSVLRASFNQYVDVDVSPIANHTLGTQVNRKCRYNPGASTADVPVYDSECVFSGGASARRSGFRAERVASTPRGSLAIPSWCCPRPGNTLSGPSGK